MVIKCNEFLIHGEVVVKETGRALAGLTVEALDDDLFFDDRLGSTVTDKDGKFEIRYDRSDFIDLFLDPKPDVFLRVLGTSGKQLLTTKDHVRYDAGGTEYFRIEIPKNQLEEEPNDMERSKYEITGKVDPKQLKDIPKKAQLTAYAIRDRKLLGSGPVKKNGKFTIKYEYDTSLEGKKKLPLGVQITFAPKMPGDSIVNEKFKRAFLPAKDFSKKQNTYFIEASDKIVRAAFDDYFIIDWFARTCVTRSPCIQTLSCSSIEDGLCYDEKDVENAWVKIYEIRTPSIFLMGTTPTETSALVAEGSTDSSGRFRAEWTRCRYRFFFPFYFVKGYRIEVGQIIDGGYNQVFMDPSDVLRDLTDDICEEVYIDRADLEEPVDAEGELTGRVFKLTRIGNIPVGYIEQNNSSAFYGYADSSDASDSATLKVKDCAIGRTIKLFANIGSGLLAGANKVGHFRLKYSYTVGGTTTEDYFKMPFRNLRDATAAEKPLTGPYVTEDLGPIAGPDSLRNVYVYPNPYDLTVDKQWVYKGLVAVIDTRQLPLESGLVTITIEPLKNDMSTYPSGFITSPGDLSFTIMVDNTLPTVNMGDIAGPYGTAVACAMLDLDLHNTYTACDGNTRKQLTGMISVPYNVSDPNQHLWRLSVFAEYGDVCDRNIAMQTVSYTDTTVVPLSSRPDWGGGSFTATSQGKTHTTDVRNNPIPGSLLNKWDQCAYQFTVRVHKRVSNGEHGYSRWDFSKHITVKDKKI
ncbi:hypothetical protein MNBD_GAMMA20-848 [hydrothermal vent metagenome]|uniref:Uncharacterized protein n=1 Tax=hydrothermal vent metagenome TaxID=652676 RepID=A0A3B1B552_9ZZZZ